MELFQANCFIQKYQQDKDQASLEVLFLLNLFNCRQCYHSSLAYLIRNNFIEYFITN
jgi:hypothetical protein